MNHVEAEGETLDEAIAKALKSLGVGREQAAIEIIAQPRKGLLGIGAKKARVRATRKTAETGEDSDTESRAGREPRQRVVDPADVAAAEKKARAALEEILRLMGADAAVESKRGDSGEEVVLEIRGDTAGLFGERKAQLLDALHYVLTRIVSETRRGVELDIDVEGYREQRRKGLEDMALRLGEKAKRQRKAVSVDPLSPADRRIVHAALEDDPWLTTKSIGSGAY
ncbi:MAG TPA: RNA-binding cell elongation regulator Jag/EloR, partial [Candidatus Binatia bacterium]|nr:RNA-binding cell elongation regulator Jag/EloR [Candidatus Binatia bacterium]